MNNFSKKFNFINKNWSASAIDISGDSKNLRYITFEIKESQEKNIIGYASIYIININKRSIEDIKKYAERYTDELELILKESNSFNENIMFLEKIFIKEKYRGKGIGKAFIGSHLDNISKDENIKKVYLFPCPIFDNRVHLEKREKIEHLAVYYKSLGFIIQKYINDTDVLMTKFIA